MKVDIIITADDIKPDKVIGKVVIVIDMLRATSVITTAIKNGCKKVIPVLTINEALEIANRDRKDSLLGGERKAEKIEGFDFSNSPLEYAEAAVKNKTLVMTTTNGTRAIKGCAGAENIFIACLLNASAVAKLLAKINRDVVIVNAGTNCNFSLDDFICSGYIITKLMEHQRVELTDIAFLAQHEYKQHEDIKSLVKYATHYGVIKRLGLEKDLEYCCTKDLTDVIPYYNGEYITRFN
ncbi:2-phosphosulfolactate phosphatase family protein [Clostridium oryzae]|uniref:Probable 2-phosphosulfolactate phosphatase n=1 Tax=Clostridium oryzae TaxID=1450648 RepID=A0A1V4ISN1_9CLOT|nr:2-phosphosulfolactate phosphatase family protein [Clostridium oryzae]OPJ63022.1 putative 2-phosphosulfolactate phosphatase [Clostridium oryzae]